MEKVISIVETDAPAILVDGEKYTLLCQYEDRYGLGCPEVYVKEGGHDVITLEGRNNTLAIVGCFSTEPSKINQLFDYIEATINRRGGPGFITWVDEDMKNLLSVAAKNGGRHPIIEEAVTGAKQSFGSKLFCYFHARKEFFSLADTVVSHFAHATRSQPRTEPSAEALAAEGNNQDEFVQRVPAEHLPDGWTWVHYDDGSGSLRSPDDEHYFSYDQMPYHHEGGIEYKENSTAPWSVYWGSFSEFKCRAERLAWARYCPEFSIEIEKPKRLSPEEEKAARTAENIDFIKNAVAGKDLSAIMSKLADNAWYGEEPRMVSITAGEHTIKIHGYTYEPHYEEFSATASISLDGSVLYGLDSHNVAAYRNETYHLGRFQTEREALAHIENVTQGLDYIVQGEKSAALNDKIQAAVSKAAEPNLSNTLAQQSTFDKKPCVSEPER